MEMCQRVSHPHLAWTYEVGVCQGVYFIAMEYIPGKSLHRLVAEEGPLAVPRAARLFGEVALALEHAHTQGLVHRDLKPSNIIITPNDHAKLLDLGLALMRGERTEDGREVIGGQGYIVGTMDYISPEQTADPSKVDARCDIYSLGCTLYFAVGGRSPFAGGTSREKIKRHRTEEAVPVNQVNSSVPVGFADLIQRMMAKDPDGRPASAAGLRFELLSWADRGKGLPLDRPDDRGYQEAVALLEAKEPSAEAVAELIPASEEPAPPGPPQAAPAPNAIPVAVIPVKPASPRRRRPPRVMKNLPREPMAPRLPLWLYFLIPTVAGILVGLALLGYYLATRT
jgi:serine/threonine protein kinase